MGHRPRHRPAPWGDRIATAETRARDAKSALQNGRRSRGLPPPTYVEEAREGPDHRPASTVAVHRRRPNWPRRAGSKRQAEQAAAADLLCATGN